MKVILFGATGMVGQGVLRECVLDPQVEGILSISRAASGQAEAKLWEIVRQDVSDLGGLETELAGYDACFFCLGVSSVGMKEADYRRVTYGLTLAVAKVLAEANPAMTFIYVSGTGTDSTEQGRTMWARVKGMTENGLQRLPFKTTCMFRPGLIQPLHGIISKTPFYRLAYTVLTPFFFLIRRIAPGFITTTEQIGRAMIAIAQGGAPQPVLENSDINRLSPLGKK